MTSLTINILEKVKKGAQQQAKKDGVTLTFILTEALKAYQQGKLKFGLLEADDEITASFDVSTDAGKKACLLSFTALSK